MPFDSFTAFLAMGGYGLYVWLSFGFSFFVLLGITVLSIRKSSHIRTDILETVQRETRMKQAKESDLL
jgi:heme exporter protein D